MKIKNIPCIVLFFFMNVLISSCELFSSLFLPQDLSSEITEASYIDSSSFKLIGKGVEWNAQADEIPKYVDVIISSQDKNKSYKIHRASNNRCELNEYVIYMFDNDIFQPGDVVNIYGTKADIIWGSAEFTVPLEKEE